MKAFLSILALTLYFVPCSRADYMVPEMKVALAGITDILDVRVSKMNEKGHAHIEILKVYKSGEQSAKVIKGTNLSCTGGSPQTFGMKSGQRYIVMLVKDQLYEEGSFFAVKVEDGVAKCQLGWRYRDKDWFNTKQEWAELSELETKIVAALQEEKRKALER